MIAVKNLYYLLLYVWDAFDEAQMRAIDAEPDTDLLNLLAAVLAKGVDHLLRRGLDRSYLPRTEAIPGVRGKLDLSATVKAKLLPSARTVCEFNELSHDIQHNQILKASLRQVLHSDSLDPELRELVWTAYLRLPHITEIRLTERAFHSVQLHRNIRYYRFLLDVCRLLYETLIPDETTGRFRFRDFARDEKRMHRLFERFLYEFYRHEQTTFVVRRRRFPWASAAGPAHDVLPTMLTDVTLERPGERLVIDAKYTPHVLQRHPYGNPTLPSGHLYQLFAYLKNLPTPANTAVDGLLLYPLAEHRIDLTFSLSNHRVRAYTLDLNQHWRFIRRDLLMLLPERSPL
jgi:5-methylcytosine-specific restriction enzyme subunit McrC